MEENEKLAESCHKKLIEFRQQAMEKLAARWGQAAVVVNDNYQEPAPVIGEKMRRKGIFVGVWAPPASASGGLCKSFNVYAAPEDLMATRTQKALLQYEVAVQEVAQLRDWHGHNGRNVRDEFALHAALRDKNYNGEWFIPPLGILNMLEEKKDTGKLSGTFVLSLSTKFYRPCEYWSSSPVSGRPFQMHAKNFLTGENLMEDKGDSFLAIRTIRLEPRP